MSSVRRVALAGIAAALAMDLAQAGFAALFERGRDPSDLDEETEAVASVVKRLGPVLPGSIAERYPATTGRIVHYTFGSVFAYAYDVAKRRVALVAYGRGLAFGVVLFVVSDVVLVPAIRFGRPWNAYSRAERLNALVSHIAYGMLLDAALSRD